MRRLSLVLGICALLASAVAWAQTDRASIIGTVTDSTGALIPGVKVTAVHTETQVQTNTESNGAGIYQLMNLPIGKYSVQFIKEGFKEVNRTNLTLEIAQVLRIDVAMALGSITEVVEVTAEAPLLEASATQVGSGLDSIIAKDLPLDIRGGRDVEAFAYATVPGVEGNSWTSHISGSLAFSKEVLIDGTSAVVQIGGAIDEMNPSFEAIQEFKVETSGVRAEDGRTGGGVYKFTIKSGTNQFHGSAFGFFRSESLDANSWTNNFYGRPRDPDSMKDYGGSIGGPIHKNKTFFFFALERYMQDDYRLGGFNNSVPTSDMLAGNFSALLNTGTILGTDALGRPIYSGEIFDPASQRAVTAGQVDPVTGLTAAQNGTVKDGFGFSPTTGAPLPGLANVIPSGRISPASAKVVSLLQQYYPPERPGLINNSQLTLSNTTFFHQNQETGKIDHNFGTKNHLSGHINWTERPRMLLDSGGLWDPALGPDGGGPLANSRSQDVQSRRVAANDSHTFTPTMMNVASFTFGRYINPSQPVDNSTNWPSKLGVGTGANNFPRISFGSAVNGISTTTLGNQWGGFYVGNSFIYNDTLSWVKSKHTFKFGGEFRALQLNSHNGAQYLGFSFSPDQTGLPQANFAASKTGFGFASFLLGAAASGSKVVPNDLYGRRKLGSLFVQDDWKLSPKLTLSLDLRWEGTGSWHEKYGRWSTFDTAVTSKSYGIPGTVVFLNNGSQTFETSHDWKEFAPHIGLGYQLNKKMVLRGSYGMFYVPIGDQYWSGVPYGWSPGYYPTDTVNPRSDKAPAFYWDKGYPGNIILPTRNPDYVPWGPVSVDPNTLFAGYTHNWSIGAQIEVAKETKLEVNYVGNVGRKLQGGDLKGNSPDMTAYSNWIKNHGEWDSVWDAASAKAEGVPYPFAGFGSYAFAALTPYPQIWQNWNWPDNIYFVGNHLGQSDYNAMQLSINRRGRGLTVLASYTLAFSHSNVQNSYGAFDETWDTYSPLQNLSSAWLNKEAGAPSNFDQRHVVKGIISYELPFGKGKRFASGASRTLDAFIGGWTLSGNFYYTSGFPLSVDSNNYYPGWYGAVYAARKAGGNYASRFNAGHFNYANLSDPANTYFDTSNFSNPAFGDFYQGVKYQSDFRGFGGAYENMAALKNFRITEHMRAQFRAEFYDIFNRHYFADPDTNIASPTFGQVINLTGSQRQGQLGVRFEF